LKEILKRWIMYADNDLKVAQHEIKNEDCVVNAVCFHAQQCVEKYLKAFLIFHDKPIVKTHDEAIRIAQKVKRFVRKKLREKGFKI
jgi:HEPN domain-containing protein